jgi:hypothetical protein
MSEVRKFEMLRVARSISPYPGWLAMIHGALGFGFLRALEDGDLVALVLVLAGVSLYKIYHWWAKRRPARFLEMTEENVRTPLEWSRWGEIPRDRVEEVVPTTEGLIIAWKKDGVPWYTEVMERWFSEEEWEKVRGALLEWGNRGMERRRRN